MSEPQTPYDDPKRELAALYYLVLAGDDGDAVIDRVLEIAQTRPAIVTVVLNGIELRVGPETKRADLANLYRIKLATRELPPAPAPSKIVRATNLHVVP